MIINETDQPKINVSEHADEKDVSAEQMEPDCGYEWTRVIWGMPQGDQSHDTR